MKDDIFYISGALSILFTFLCIINEIWIGVLLGFMSCLWHTKKFRELARQGEDYGNNRS